MKPNFDIQKNQQINALKSKKTWYSVESLMLNRKEPRSSIPVNPRGELLHLPEGETVKDYVRDLVQAGRIVVGIEGGEADLPYAIKVAGAEAFIFSSDFPHEVNAQTVQKEIRELCENEED